MRKTLEYVDWTELRREFDLAEQNFLLKLITVTGEVTDTFEWFPDQECETVSDYVSAFGEDAAMARRVITKLEELDAINIYVRF